MIQVLFSHGWDEVLWSVAWVVDDLVMRRVLTGDGSTFDRWSTSTTLTDEWSLESIYVFFRPALLANLNAAFELLGRSVDVLDNVPSGSLAPPVRWWAKRIQ